MLLATTIRPPVICVSEIVTSLSVEPTRPPALSVSLLMLAFFMLVFVIFSALDCPTNPPAMLLATTVRSPVICVSKIVTSLSVEPTRPPALSVTLLMLALLILDFVIFKNPLGCATNPPAMLLATTVRSPVICVSEIVTSLSVEPARPPALSVSLLMLAFFMLDFVIFRDPLGCATNPPAMFCPFTVKLPVKFTELNVTVFSPQAINPPALSDFDVNEPFSMSKF